MVEVKKQLGEMVLGTVEQTLNAMPDAEADEITQAHKYERTESRADTRAGHYHRKLMTKAGEVDLKIPKLWKLPFETAIIERYRRREDKESRIRFLRSLKDRGLHGTRLIVGDRCLGLVESIHEVFSDALYQRCMVHFMRNILCDVPRSGGKEVGAMLKAIFTREDGDACHRKAAEVAEKLHLLKLKSAEKTLEGGIEEALVYTQFPHEHWLRIRSNNGIERLNREIRRRTNAAGTFPAGNSALMPFWAGLRHVSATDWGTKTYLNMKHLYELERDQAESNQMLNA